MSSTWQCIIASAPEHSLVGFSLVDEAQRSVISCAQISNFFPNFQMAKLHSGNFWACPTVEGAELSSLND